MAHFYVIARYRILKLGDLKTVLKQLCILGLLAATVLVSTSTAAFAGGRRGRPHPPQPLVSPMSSVEPQNEFADPVNDGSSYVENGYGDWTDPTVQSSNQEAITNAVATGDRSTATSNVNQFNYQSRYGNQGVSGNQYGYWSAPSIQISVQQATANAVANGNNTTAASNIHQMNHQEGWNSPDGWGDGYDYGVDPQAQISTQQAVGNAIATGDHSNATSNIDQTNVQDYPLDPGSFDYGYGYGY
jgi:hypothetical protein